MFITAYRFSEAGAHKLLVTGYLAMWGILYSVISLLVGKLTTSRRAPWFLFFSGAVLFCSSWGFILVPGLYLQYLWMAVIALGFSFYCVPFQVFSKDLEEGKSGGTVRVSSLYTLTWSLGMAAGPMFFALLTDWRQGFKYLSLIPLLALACVFLLLRLRNGRTASAQCNTDVEEEYRGKPNLMLIGWIGGLLGTIAVTIIRTLEPDLAVERGLGQSHAGMILALVSYVQGFVALSFIKSRKWMYNPWCMLLSALVGATGFFLFAYSHCLPLLYLAAVLYGFCSGVLYFLLTFHAQVDPKRNTKYVAITETLVGLANITGPLLGGWLAQKTSTGMAFYLAAGLVLLMGVLQFAFTKRARQA